MWTIEKALFLNFVLGSATVAIAIWLTYWAIKTGVRDGIREAGGERTSRRDTRPAAMPGYKWVLVKDDAPGGLPDMRAD